MPTERTIELSDISGTAPQGPVRVAVISSAYNAWITDALTQGAADAFHKRLAEREDAELTITRVPGAWELAAVAGAASAAETEDGEPAFDAIVCLGCVIKGETRHDEVISDAIAQALADLSVGAPIPVGLGLLTVNTPEQAEARAGGDLGNKGAEAMDAALDTLAAIRALCGSGAAVRAE